MEKSLLHVDIGSLYTNVRVLSVTQDRLTVRRSASYPTPLQDKEGDRTAGISRALDAVEQEAPSGAKPERYDRISVTLGASGEMKAACVGVIKGITGESARRAALSAGATVTDLISVDDGRQDFERISDLRRQDISVVVMAGGVDEEVVGQGNRHIVNMAKLLAQGVPQRRWGTERVPVVYAASSEFREEALKALGDVPVVWAENVRARLEEEHLDSARQAVVGIITEAVKGDPRYKGLGRLGLPDVLPSGHVTGLALERLHAETGENLLALSLDGDAVQVFSVMNGVFSRTVTPIGKPDPKKVARWVPHRSLSENLAEIMANMASHPRLLPATWDEHAVFLAILKEAVRAALTDHKASAIELRGVHRRRMISETFEVEVAGGDTLIRMPVVHRIVVTGALSRLLSDSSLVSLVLDGVRPMGATKVYKDPDALLEVSGLLDGDGPDVNGTLVSLAVIVSGGQERDKPGSGWAFIDKDGAIEELPVVSGEISQVQLGAYDRLEIVLEAGRQEDLGEGPGRKALTGVEPGFKDLYVDGRSRLALERGDRITPDDALVWYKNLGLMPDQVLSRWAGRRE